MLQQTTNMHILKVAMSVWPKAHIIVTADNPEQASELYDAGAHYVLRSAKLCAERILEKKKVWKDWSKMAGESCPWLESLLVLAMWSRKNMEKWVVLLLVHWWKVGKRHPRCVSVPVLFVYHTLDLPPTQ